MAYHRASKNIYFLATTTSYVDDDGNTQYDVCYLKIKKLGSDRIRIYLVGDDPSETYFSWGTWSYADDD